MSILSYRLGRNHVYYQSILVVSHVTEMCDASDRSRNCYTTRYLRIFELRDYLDFVSYLDRSSSILESSIFFSSSEISFQVFKSSSAVSNLSLSPMQLLPVIPFVGLIKPVGFSELAYICSSRLKFSRLFDRK